MINWFKVKSVLPVCVLCGLAFLIVARGGGGGGGGTTIGGGNGGGNGGGTGNFGFAPLAGQYIEFVNQAGNGVRDPFNLAVGDTVTLRLVNYDSAGNRTVLTTSNWSLTGATSAQIALNPASGVLQVISRPANFWSVSVSASIGGTNTVFTQRAFVPNASTIVRGRVVNDATGAPLIYVDVEFYNAQDELIGASKTLANGEFAATVPGSVAGMSMDPNKVPAAHFYRTIRYSGVWYTMDGTTCAIKIGPFGPGGNTLPAPLRVPPSGTAPPPPPAGCFN